MKKILDKVYEPQSVFQKTNSVYMEWYGRGDEKMYKEKSGANQVMVDYIQKNAKETGKEVRLRPSRWTLRIVHVYQ